MRKISAAVRQVARSTQLGYVKKINARNLSHTCRQLVAPRCDDLRALIFFTYPSCVLRATCRTAVRRPACIDLFFTYTSYVLRITCRTYSIFLSQIFLAIRNLSHNTSRWYVKTLYRLPMTRKNIKTILYLRDKKGCGYWKSIAYWHWHYILYKRKWL